MGKSGLGFHWLERTQTWPYEDRLKSCRTSKSIWRMKRSLKKNQQLTISVWKMRFFPDSRSECVTSERSIRCETVSILELMVPEIVFKNNSWQTRIVYRQELSTSPGESQSDLICFALYTAPSNLAKPEWVKPMLFAFRISTIMLLATILLCTSVA